eukprot:3265230-Rhodomonas_salina.2
MERRGLAIVAGRKRQAPSHSPRAEAHSQHAGQVCAGERIQAGRTLHILCSRPQCSLRPTGTERAAVEDLVGCDVIDRRGERERTASRNTTTAQAGECHHTECIPDLKGSPLLRCRQMPS